MVCNFLSLFLGLLFIKLSLADKYEKDLIRHLMSSYDKRIRPSKNASHSLSVTFGLALAQLIDVVSSLLAVISPAFLSRSGNI